MFRFPAEIYKTGLVIHDCVEFGPYKIAIVENKRKSQDNLILNSILQIEENLLLYHITLL